MAKMKTQRIHSVKFNFVMNFILTASSILFPLITFPYVSGILLPAGTGRVSFAVSLVSYFTMVAMLGVPTYGVRAVARVRDNKKELSATVQELMIINLCMAALAYLCFFIALGVVPKMEQSRTLMLICSSAILLNAIGVTWFYQGMEQYAYITWASIGAKVVSVIMMFLCIHSPKDYLWYGAMSVISSFGSYILNFLRLPSYIDLKPVRPWNFRRHLKPIMTFFAMSVATTIYTEMDKVMLGFMTTDYEVGLYDAAGKIKILLVSLVTSLGTVLLPRLSVFIQKKELREFEELVSKAMSFVLLFSVPTVIFAMVWSSQILTVIAGPEYLPAAAAMNLLMPTVLLIGLSNIIGIQILVPTGREKMTLISVVAGALLDLVLNLLFIPRFGAAGAAFGTLSAEFLVLFIQGWSLKDLMKKILPRVEFRQLLISQLLALPALFLALLLPSVLGTGRGVSLVMIIIGALVYYGVYGTGLILSKETILKGIVNGFLTGHSRQGLHGSVSDDKLERK